jgi:uncharacterized membrane protein
VEHHIDERLVHRLEAFSDIVIALSLSEIAFNLQLPARGHDIIAHPIYLVGFLVGFTFVAAVWWLHNRIFTRYFIPDTVGIIGNFLLLAAIVLFAWATQLFYRSGLDSETAIVFAATGGTMYLLIGLLFLRGCRDERLQLASKDRAWARHRGLRALIVGAFLLASIALAPLGTVRMEYCWIASVPVVLILQQVQRRTSSAFSTP